MEVTNDKEIEELLQAELKKFQQVVTYLKESKASDKKVFTELSKLKKQIGQLEKASQENESSDAPWKEDIDEFTKSLTVVQQKSYKNGDLNKQLTRKINRLEKTQNWTKISLAICFFMLMISIFMHLSWGYNG